MEWNKSSKHLSICSHDTAQSFAVISILWLNSELIAYYIHWIEILYGRYSLWKCIKDDEYLIPQPTCRGNKHGLSLNRLVPIKFCGYDLNH